jgi:hypothetical protein
LPLLWSTVVVLLVQRVRLFVEERWLVWRA